ncbi:MAG: hypothetical protein SNJ57_12510 [Cyanobacteriota bacterium]
MKISTPKIVAYSALAVSLLGSAAELANAVPVAINVTGKDSVTFVVSGLSNATGFGGHFSAGNSEDGWGGTHAECHLVAGPNPDSTVTLWCYDGYQSDSEHVNAFRLELGPKRENNQSVLSQVILTVSRRGVHVDVTRIATSAYTPERKPYTISSFFPLRESSGFFKTGTIFYQGGGNGVLSGRPDRPGTGYVLAPPIVR